ncbi:phosphatidylinositol-3,4,5-trisphosphate 3-phosphatase [Caerostris extrusa]|nr:phosphatidylinositol-3,4,5-trisphosphate 3-phosphatase [Caerostris extrusa]
MSKYHTFENESDQESPAITVEAEHLDASLSKSLNTTNGTSVSIIKSKTVGQSRFVENTEDTDVSVVISDPAELEEIGTNVG